MDGWTDLSRRIRAKIMDAAAASSCTPEKMLAAFEDSDFEKMEEIRARVDAIVEDRETAARASRPGTASSASGRASTTSTCRPSTTPGTHLVDTDGKGVERITETGVVVAGREYEVDCIIYASGFEVGTEYTRRAGFDLTGRDGVKLSEHWADGHAHQARHPRPRLPERVHRAADAGRQPHLQRAAQPHRGRQDDRADDPARAGERLQGDRGHQGGRGRAGSSCC